MQEKYWNYMVQIKAWVFYLDIYAESSYKWERGINMFSAIASSGSIAAWTIWDEFSYVWAFVIAASQVLTAIRSFLPYSRRLKFLVPFMENLKFLYNKIEYNWFKVASGDLSEEEINELLYNFKDEFTNIENKNLKEETLVERRDFQEMTNEYIKELTHYLTSFWQYDLAYVKMLKASISNPNQWSELVDDIVKKSRYEDFICKLLHEEKRYDALMSKIEQSSNNVGLLDAYEKVLRKNMPERVIKIYSAYLEKAAEMANERKKYKYLMPYLKKISRCEGGKIVAEDIAASWRREYKRRTAMMDELRKAGF